MGSNPVGVTNTRRVRSWNSGTDAFFLCSLTLYIRPCRLQSPRALHHFTPERSEVYPYHTNFSHIRKVGVLHILFQYIIFSPKQNRGIGEKTEKLPIFSRPLTSSISPISRFSAKMPLSLYIKGCFVAIFTKSAAINRRPSPRFG